MTGFYRFNQNNSGGYIITDDESGIGDYVFIFANSFSQANEKAEEIGMFNLPYCDCCGVRFYSLWGYEEPMKDGEEDSFFTINSSMSIFFHFPNGEVKKATINRGGMVKYTWTEDAIKALTAN
jgi:hypothetical protein